MVKVETLLKNDFANVKKTSTKALRYIKLFSGILSLVHDKLR